MIHLIWIISDFYNILMQDDISECCKPIIPTMQHRISLLYLSIKFSNGVASINLYSETSCISYYTQQLIMVYIANFTFPDWNQFHNALQTASAAHP